MEQNLCLSPLNSAKFNGHLTLKCSLTKKTELIKRNKFLIHKLNTSNT